MKYLNNIFYKLRGLLDQKHSAKKMPSNSFRKEYYVGIAASSSETLIKHLLSRAPDQEEVCIALYRKGAGELRQHILFSDNIDDFIFPASKEDRKLQGDISLIGDYVERCAKEARSKGCGLAIIHSHPLGVGPQGMSNNDYKTEQSFAGFVYASTGHELLGLTLSGDKKWSGRIWLKNKNIANKYYPKHIMDFRTIGKENVVIMQDLKGAHDIPRSVHEKIQATVAAYGEENQKIISGMKIGVIGLGSVGSAISESLVRIGVRHLVLCDHDLIEDRNLDRLTNANVQDIGKSKVLIAKQKLQSIGIHKTIDIVTTTVKFAHKSRSFSKMLDCDLIFCCVDNKDARHAVNQIAFRYLVPVIETGLTIVPEEKDGKIKGMKTVLLLAHTLLPGFKCLQCLDQCEDREQYVQTENLEYKNRGRENIFPLSVMIASIAVFNMIQLVSGSQACSRIEVILMGLKWMNISTQNGECDKERCIVANEVGLGDKK